MSIAAHIKEFLQKDVSEEQIEIRDSIKDVKQEINDFEKIMNVLEQVQKTTDFKSFDWKGTQKQIDYFIVDVERCMKIEQKLVHILLIKAALDLSKDKIIYQRANEAFRHEQMIFNMSKELESDINGLGNKIRNSLTEIEYTLIGLIRRNQFQILENRLPEIKKDITKLLNLLNSIEQKMITILKAIRIRDYIHYPRRKITKKAFNIKGKRVEIQVFNGRETDKLYESVRKVKKLYSHIPYLSDSSTSRIMYELQDQVIKTVKEYLYQDPGIITESPFYLQVCFDEKDRCTFEPRKSRKSVCNISLGTELVLSEYIIQIYRGNQRLLRDFDDALKSMGYSRLDNEIQGFLKNSLHQALAHELQHFKNFVNEMKKHGGHKGILHYEEKTDNLPLDIQIIKEEGITRTLDFKSRKFIVFDLNKISKLKHQLNTFYVGYDTGEYSIGFYMAYIIGLAFLKKKNPLAFNNLRATTRADYKDVKFFKLGLNVILRGKNKYYLENLPKEFISSFITELSHLTAIEFFNYFYKAANYLGISKEYHPVPKAVFNEMKKKLADK